MKPVLYLKEKAQMFKSGVGAELWAPALHRHWSHVTEKRLHSGAETWFLTATVNISVSELPSPYCCRTETLSGGRSLPQCSSAEPVYTGPARPCPQRMGTMDHLAPKMLGGVSWQSAWVPAALTLTLRGQEDNPRCYMRLGGAFSPLGRRSSTEWQQSRDALRKKMGFAAQHHSPDTGLPFGYPIWSERSHR